MATLSTPTTPIDLLGAVNLLLATIGQAQIATLITADLKEDARKALETLGQTAVEVQSRGWEFNTDRCATLSPAPDGTIALPSNCLRVKTLGSSRSTHVVMRGGKLYLPRKQTFTISRPLTVDMVVALEFSDLPSAARWYITCLAGRRFATPELASGSSFQFTKVEEDKALISLEQEDAETNDSSMGETSPHVAFMRRR